MKNADEILKLATAFEVLATEKPLCECGRRATYFIPKGDEVLYLCEMHGNKNRPLPIKLDKPTFTPITPHGVTWSKEEFEKYKEIQQWQEQLTQNALVRDREKKLTDAKNKQRSIVKRLLEEGRRRERELSKKK